ncbi:peptide chain release factor 2 [Sodalis-like secondary symbiont of Drepanosiphum platanoidis]|uniref:peptide chain release factor 2 n=1 Tax=Sodalis-like secondary symbiont of Drepanosiphum platanoidis TaxID=2994493 RepID=UPI003463FC25
MFEINYLINKIKEIKNKINLIRRIFNYSLKKNKLKKLSKKLNDPDIWKNFLKIKKLKKEQSFLKSDIKNIDFFIQNISEINDFFELAIKEKDKEILKEIKNNIYFLEKKIINFEKINIFKKKYDKYNCYLDIQSGSGGTEAQDWANILLRMYLRWIESKNFKIDIIEISEGEICGIKSATIKILGKYAYGWMRTETGIHRLVRKSPFDSGNKRHTSFSSAFIYPDINNKIDIKINLSDLRIDVYRASGAGGQHVNRTESAVRVTHIPTKIVTQCQSDRSQHKNKDQAIKQLKLKLYKFELQKKNITKNAIEQTKQDIGWGRQIRSYILDNSRIKDLRTGIEITNVQSVLDGNLDKFIIASLKMGL